MAFRRIHLALARYEESQIKPDNKQDPKDGWTTKDAFDVAAWHAAQAGLWASLGEIILPSVG